MGHEPRSHGRDWVDPPYEANHDAVVESRPPPIGRRTFRPVVAHQYLREKLDAITVT